MRVLVTGVSGFVGGHLAEHLIAAGDLVVIGSRARLKAGGLVTAKPIDLPATEGAR